MKEKLLALWNEMQAWVKDHPIKSAVLSGACLLIGFLLGFWAG